MYVRNLAKFLSDGTKRRNVTVIAKTKDKNQFQNMKDINQM